MVLPPSVGVRCLATSVGKQWAARSLPSSLLTPSASIFPNRPRITPQPGSCILSPRVTEGKAALIGTIFLNPRSSPSVFLLIGPMGANASVSPPGGLTPSGSPPRVPSVLRKPFIIPPT